MARFIRRAAPAALGLLLAAAFARASAPVYPLNQVKAGLKGKARSVFLGNTVEEFDAEILGLVTNPNPKRTIIIARLSGHPALAGSGVIAGMSGSPVYIDGKILGAIAYGFPYSKEPIAGITPIAEMLAVAADPAKPGGVTMPAAPFNTAMTVDDLLAAERPSLESRPSFAQGGAALTPLRVPLLFSGFPPRSMDAARRIFGPLGFQPALAGAQQAADKTLAADLSLREGDAVALQLITGDLDVSAVGTVTYVDGDKILAFGHPLYNLGPVSYGMAKAKVITVVPTLDNPYKMAVAGSPVGSFAQDRTAGALGFIGRAPRTVPLAINLIGEGGALREFKLNVTADKLLTPLLMNIAVSAILTGENRSLGDLTLEFEGNLYLDSGQNVHLEDMFSGNLDAAATDLSGLTTSVAYYLTNNEFGDVGLHRIDLNVRVIEQIKRAQLERVWLDKYEAAPGESISIRVYYRGYRGETQMEELPFAAPRLPPGTEFQLVVGDAASMAQIEAGQYRARGVMPRSLPQLIRLLSSLRKHNRIYFKVLAPKPGLFLRGEELPNLPPSLKSMFLSSRASAFAPTELNTSTLTEYQMPLPFVFNGAAVVPVRIRK
jgi:hypothetical protein